MIISDFVTAKHLKRVFLAVGLFVSSALTAATFTVTNTADSGAGSLRDAINQVNAGAGNDTIAFNIPGAGVHRIQPLTDLPAIVQPNTLVDGYTQPGTSVNTDPLATNAVLLIEINGSNYTVGDGITTGTGLALGSGSTGSTIRGLIFNEWLLRGIFITGSANSKVYGNFIGTNADGTAQLANRAGLISTNSAGVLVGSSSPADRNLFAGSFEFFVNGYMASVGGAGTTVKGNLFGLDRTGTYALGNSVTGIRIATGVIVGGPNSADRNVISGSLGIGVYINGASNCTIQGNYIGTDVTGTLPVGNGNAGILIVAANTVTSANNLIQGNLISANGTGIKLGSAYRNPSNTVNNTRVYGNLIGTDVTGQNALGNERQGVWLMNGSNFVGGALASQRNIISGNHENGINITDFGLGNFVQGNYIGLDITGTRAIGNGQNGVLIGASAAVQLANNNTIGGYNAGEGNVISGNRLDGVKVRSHVKGNQIVGNWIGTDYTGVNPVPNGAAGIRFLCAPDNFQGGNTIAYNKQGVLICEDTHACKPVKGHVASLIWDEVPNDDESVN
jgi:parallel beta-helix repeat protein